MNEKFEGDNFPLGDGRSYTRVSSFLTWRSIAIDSHNTCYENCVGIYIIISVIYHV